MLSVKSIKSKKDGVERQAINIKYSGWKPTKEEEIAKYGRKENANA